MVGAKQTQSKSDIGNVYKLHSWHLQATKTVNS
jgi:hypothetical protein